MNIYLPLYFQPSLQDSRCQRVLQAMRDNQKVRFAVIINLHSGPGKTPDSKAAEFIGAAKTLGAIILGYVDAGFIPNTDTGVCYPLEKTHWDMDAWKSWYSIDGYWFDDLPNSTVNLPETDAIISGIKAMVDRAHDSGLQAWGNTARPISARYITECGLDVCNIWEHTLLPSQHEYWSDVFKQEQFAELDKSRVAVTVAPAQITLDGLAELDGMAGWVWASETNYQDVTRYLAQIVKDNNPPA